MSSQSSLDRFKENQITSKELRWLLAGAFAGLVLGLVIGWVLWPVEWQGGDVSALTQTAQVEYLDTVAAAYAGDQSPSRLDTARQRLEPLGAELPALFEAALVQTAAQPDSAAQQANLTALASALSVSAAGLPTAAPTVEVDAAPAASVTGGEEARNEGGGSSVNLFFLGALLFVVGGAGLWWAYQQGWFGKRSSSAQTTSQPAPAKADQVEPLTAPQSRSTASAYSTVQAAATKVTPVQPPTMGDVQPFDPDEPSASTAPLTRINMQPLAPSLSVPSSTAGAFVGDDDWDGDEAGGNDNAAAPAPATSKERTPSGAAGWMAGAGRLERYPTIDRFETTYTVGMQHFDRTQNIPGPQEGLYQGEYGIGISERHGILNNDPDQVVAIEVYIFDKSDENHPVNVGRVVLSEYADSHLRKHFEREKDRLGPIVAQPNTTLQLEARQFVLICTITDVAYTDEGIFQRVSMQMELKKKN
jgi:hypothetical protein